MTFIVCRRCLSRWDLHRLFGRSTCPNCGRALEPAA
jgi:hypothetical protein